MENIVYQICTYDDIKTELPSYWNFAKAVTVSRLLCVSARIATKLVGVLITESVLSEKNIILRFIYVTPKYRYRKIGTKLWTFLLSEQKSHCYRYSVAFIESSAISTISSFFVSIGFSYVRIDCSCIVITTNSWNLIVLPRISVISAAVVCKYKLRSETTFTEERLLSDIVRKENVPIYLNPFLLLDNMEDQVVFFSDTGELIGWCVFKKINTKTIDFKCIYILKRYRDNRYVFAFFKMMTFHILQKYPAIESLIINYDNTNTQLNVFYKKLLKNCEYNCYSRVVYEYEVSSV